MRGLACGDELLKRGSCTRNESFARFGHTDTAGCADQERCANACFKCTYCLADCRRSHPEFRGRPPKTAVLGDAQERLHAVEGTSPHCEILLHSSSTLSQIVSRRNRWYL